MVKTLIFIAKIVERILQGMEEEFKIRMAAFQWLKDHEVAGRYVFRGSETFRHERDCVI